VSVPRDASPQEPSPQEPIPDSEVALAQSALHTVWNEMAGIQSVDPDWVFAANHQAAWQLMHKELLRRLVREKVDAIKAVEAASVIEPPESRSLAEELADPREHERSAIPDWAPDGGNIGIEAGTGVGKTTLGGNTVKSLVDHLPFLGNEEWTPRQLQGNVGFCNYELPEWQFADWLGAMGIRNTKRVIPWHLRGYRMPMHVDLVVEQYINWCRDYDIEVWWLDPRNRAWQGMVLDENNNSQINAWAMQVDAIKQEAGVKELYLPAHMGHEHERGRGGSAWGDWLDAIWVYTKDAKTGIRSLSTRKLRGDGDQPKWPLTFNRATKLLTVRADSESAEDDAIISVVKAVIAEPGISQRKLKANMRNCAQNERLAVIGQAIMDGYITMTVAANNAQLHDITDKGIALAERHGVIYGPDGEVLA
jgi:hypothetical protein